jgi:hypothetical protein
MKREFVKATTARLCDAYRAHNYPNSPALLKKLSALCDGK